MIGRILIAGLTAWPALAQDVAPQVPDGPLEPAISEDLMDPTPFDLWLADPSTSFEAPQVDLADFLWRARPLVVFADTPADPAFQRQVELLAARVDDLAERDIVVILDADPGAGSEIREKLRPRGFMLAIIGKDGGVKLRKPFPWDVREISRTVDKMPMRRQEIRERRDRGT